MRSQQQRDRITRASGRAPGVRLMYGVFAHEVHRPFNLQFPLPQAVQEEGAPVNDGWLDRLMNMARRLFFADGGSERPVGISRLGRTHRPMPAMAEVPVGSPFFLRESLPGTSTHKRR